MLVFIVSK